MNKIRSIRSLDIKLWPLKGHESVDKCENVHGKITNIMIVFGIFVDLLGLVHLQEVLL